MISLGKGQQIFDQTERLQINTARLKKGGSNFEVVVDPDMAVAFKEGKDIPIRDVLKSQEIFFDPRKGELASETRMKAVFDTDNALEIAKTVISEGDIQLTQEHRNKIREAKRNKIINIIHRNALDPKTGNPHPLERIKLAMEEGKIRIDEFKKPEDQVKQIVETLQSIIPIRFDKLIFSVIIDPQHAGKMYSVVKSFGAILEDNWANDGSWQVKVEIPAGLKLDFFDELNNKTQGSVQIEEMKKR